MFGTFSVSEFELKQIQELRVELDTEFKSRTEPAKPCASHTHISINQRRLDQ